MPTQAGFIMLVAQYSKTDCQYAFVLVIGIFKGRIEVISHFEVLPVLLKLLGVLLVHCRFGLVKHWTIAKKFIKPL
jgi:hypothetical protein